MWHQSIRCHQPLIHPPTVLGINWSKPTSAQALSPAECPGFTHLLWKKLQKEKLTFYPIVEWIFKNNTLTLDCYSKTNNSKRYSSKREKIFIGIIHFANIFCHGSFKWIHSSSFRQIHCLSIKNTFGHFLDSSQY